MLPESLAPSLREQLSRARAWWLKDQCRGPQRRCFLDALERSIRAPGILAVVLVFAQHTHSTDPRSGVVRRHHMYDQTFQRAFKRAVEQAGITKPATPHTLRHSFATACSAAVTIFIRTVQDLLGHSDVSTTMIYTHVLESWRCRSALTASMRCRPSLVRGRAAQVNPGDTPLRAKAIGAASNGRLRKVLPASADGRSPSLPDGSNLRRCYSAVGF